MKCERLKLIVCLPNKQGDYRPVVVPQYVITILENVRNQYDYTYKLYGTSPQRPGYGINADLERLGAWVKRYHADFVIKVVSKERKHYYGIFEMTDPVALQLKKVGLLK